MVPYIDPADLPLDYENKDESVENDFAIPKIIQRWTEPMTYKCDNYAHFLSEDCKPRNQIAKLLISTECLDLQDHWECRPETGRVLATPHGGHKTYSIVIKKYQNYELDWDEVSRGLQNLPIALKRDKQTTCSMSNSGDLLGSLPQNKISEVLSKRIPSHEVITITLCHGKIEVPPNELHPKIISEYHSSLIRGHKGITKTYKRIRDRYSWPEIREDVTEYIRSCKSCLEQKLVRGRTRESMIITDTPGEPYDKVSLDKVGKLPITHNGNRHILTMQDNVSKYCIAVPIPDLRATTIAHAEAANLFSQYGAPRCIVTDRGGGFISNVMKKLENLFKVKRMTTSGYRPQKKGSLERSHILITDYIKHCATDYDDWDQLLPFAMFAYNTSVHEATNFTPYELVFGRVARTLSSSSQGEEVETSRKYGIQLYELSISRSSPLKI